MSDQSVFDLVSEKIEESTPLNRLESRGTLRIALKDAGFDAKAVSASQLVVVIQKLLPQHFEERGISDAASVCETISGCLSGAAAEDSSDSPEAIFTRLGS